MHGANAGVPLLLLMAVSLRLPVVAADQGFRSQWVFLNSDVKLGYKALPARDRVMDFSFAGYRPVPAAWVRSMGIDWLVGRPAFTWHNSQALRNTGY